MCGSNAHAQIYLNVAVFTTEPPPTTQPISTQPEQTLSPQLEEQALVVTIQGVTAESVSPLLI